MSDKVHVLVRLRSADTPESSSWNVQDNSLVHRTNGAEQVTYSCFDTVLDNATNQDVYTRHLRPFVACCLEGTSCVVFAYGQTGSGKTHTILGSSNEKGLVQLSVADLFDQGAAEVRISYVEIYNEKIFDLISPERAVRLLDVAGTPKLSNATEVAAGTKEKALQLVESCMNNRKTGATEFNLRSSRSHTVFTVSVMGKGVSSKLCLIDLAGSERAADAQERRMEGSFINRSLLALGKAVDSMSRNNFVCFRDSKLTRVLQPSLDGSTKLVALCMISPLKRCEDESISTLGFAARLGKMKLEAKSVRVGCVGATPSVQPAQICTLCRSAIACARELDGRFAPDTSAEGEDKTGGSDKIYTYEVSAPFCEYCTSDTEYWCTARHASRGAGAVHSLDAGNILMQSRFLLQKMKLYQQRVEYLEQALLSVYTKVPRRASSTFSIEKNLFGVRCRLLEKALNRDMCGPEDGTGSTAKYPQ